MFGRSPRRPERRSARGERHELAAASWSGYFDRLAERAGPCLVAVEVVAHPADLGGASKRRLREIGYDAAADMIEIAAGDRAAGDTLSLRHMIAAPRSITVRDTAASIEIVIVDAARVQTRIDLLPTARAARSRRRRRRLRGDASIEALMRPRPTVRRTRGGGCPTRRACRDAGRRLRGFYGKPSESCG